MIKNLLASLALLAIGWGSGYISAEHMRPTRMDIAEKLAENIMDDHEGVTTELYQDAHHGPIVYIRKESSERDPAWIAKIEIGHDGEYLASYWNPRQEFFEHHFGRSSSLKRIEKAIEVAKTSKKVKPNPAETRQIQLAGTLFEEEKVLESE